MERAGRKRGRVLFGVAGSSLLAAAILAAAWWTLGKRTSGDGDAGIGREIQQPVAAWVDESSCQSCHLQQHQAWQGSHHQRAMQPATEATVAGDFEDASLETDQERTRFLRRRDGNGSGDYIIETPGPDGVSTSFEVEYTFGVEPLQQYLIRLADGRRQAHGAAWDTEARRWFHLYDGEGVDHRHRLHWSGPQQNADFMCIECHTTNFERGYDPAEDRYESSWLAEGVGCQSCHGPASRHLAWAAGEEGALAETKGFERGLAARGDPLEVQTCARCHSRRTPLGNGYTHGADLLDDYLPMILTADLYEVDGKIKDEVFEYGSFVQSKMHQAGVSCSDCHDPHTARLRAEGNAVCTQCHSEAGAAARGGIDASALQAKRYDDPSHHHHGPGSEGASCVSCHMPGRVYMGNDLRRDHSFSSPHPKQAIALSLWDACLGCHEGEEAEVVAAFDARYPEASPRDGGYAQAVHLARSAESGAAAALHRQLARSDLPEIRLATLLHELPAYPSRASAEALVSGMGHGSALVRRSAVDAAGALLPPQLLARLLSELVGDPVRAVRLAAAWQLLQLQPPKVEPQRLIAEYEASQESMLDRAEARYNLAGIYALTGREDQVEAALLRSLRQDPAFHPATIMLAQWREQAAQDPEGARRLLDDAIERHPDEPSLHHALGLMQVRRGSRDQAVASLRRAYELGPDQPDLGYVLAVAVHGGGNEEEALQILEDVQARHPTHRPTMEARLSYLGAAGRGAEAEAILERLRAMNPDDPLLRAGSPPASTLPSTNDRQLSTEQPTTE